MYREHILVNKYTVVFFTDFLLLKQPKRYLNNYSRKILSHNSGCNFQSKYQCAFARRISIDVVSNLPDRSLTG